MAFKFAKVKLVASFLLPVRHVSITRKMHKPMNTEITAIWKDFHKELKTLIQNKTRNTADTDDILQDVFLKILRHSDKIAAAQNLRLYLYGIVRNTISDHFRNNKPLLQSTAMIEEWSESENQNLNTTVAECCVRPFIQKLPANYREALLITEFQDVSQKDLAQQLGISYSGLKSRVQRGKEQLRRMILACCAYESDKYGNLSGKEEKNCGCS